MWRRVKRILFRRAAVAFVSATILVVSACSVEAAPSHTDQQWRMPLPTELVAAASTLRSAAGLPGRPHLVLPLFVPLVTREALALGDAGLQPPRREGSLPPARQRYRRTVHDDSDPPA